MRLAWTRAGLAALATLDALSVAYLLGLLAAAATARKRPKPAPPARPASRLAVLVPAHDEEREIATAIASLNAQIYPRDRFVVTVIADNCSDRTAEAARAEGAVVYERRDELRSGKGHALAWGIERVREDSPDIDAITILDADCEASPNYLDVMSRHIADGAAGAQARIRIANAEETWAAALQAASFDLISEVRARGRDRLGLSAWPQGTGTTLTIGLLDRVPWDAFSPAEDVEYGARLIAAGERFDRADGAVVTTRAATAFGEAGEQQRRWESGRWTLIREWLPRHLAAGLRYRDGRRLAAALELIVPPQSLLLVTSVAAAISGRALAMRSVGRLAWFSLTGQGLFVFGGLALAGAPPGIYRALVRAPLLAAWKAPVQLRGIAGRGPTRWVKGPRRPVDRSG